MESQHVLVIDPDQVSRVLVKRSLSESYNVITLSSSLEAIAFIQSNCVDVILVNIAQARGIDFILLLGKLESMTAQGDRVILPKANKAYLGRYKEGLNNIPEKRQSLQELHKALSEKPDFGVINLNIYENIFSYNPVWTFLLHRAKDHRR